MYPVVQKISFLRMPQNLLDRSICTLSMNHNHIPGRGGHNVPRDSVATTNVEETHTTYQRNRIFDYSLS